MEEEELGVDINQQLRFILNVARNMVINKDNGVHKLNLY